MTDTERLDWLEARFLHSKWDDAMPYLRPHDDDWFVKYSGQDGWTIRRAIDAKAADDPLR